MFVRTRMQCARQVTELISRVVARRTLSPQVPMPAFHFISCPALSIMIGENALFICRYTLFLGRCMQLLMVSPLSTGSATFHLLWTRPLQFQSIANRI